MLILIVLVTFELLELLPLKKINKKKCDLKLIGRNIWLVTIRFLSTGH
jgi:hypothetical protein